MSVNMVAAVMAAFGLIVISLVLTLMLTMKNNDRLITMYATQFCSHKNMELVIDVKTKDLQCRGNKGETATIVFLE